MQYSSCFATTVFTKFFTEIFLEVLGVVHGVRQVSNVHPKDDTRVGSTNASTSGGHTSGGTILDSLFRPSLLPRRISPLFF